MSAATAPSVATIGATIETLPIRSAAYVELETDDVADAGQAEQRRASMARASRGLD